MKTIRRLVILLFLPVFAYAGQDSSSPPILATLTLPHGTVLPGVPFDITVTLKNVSTHAATAGLSARLIVTLPDGTKFSPKTYHPLEPHDPSFQYIVELMPGESRQFASMWNDGPPNWSHYEVYTAPGIYDVALELGASNAPANYVGPIATNSARLQRVVPPGEDEALWRRMAAARNCRMMYSTAPPRQVCIGGWSDGSFTSLKEGVAIAKEIRDLHPTSQYYPYAILLQFRHDDSDLPKALDAAERFPNSPAYPYLLLLAAGRAESKAFRAEREHDSAGAKTNYDLATRLFEEILSKSSNAAVLDRARRGEASMQWSLRPSPSQ